MKKVGRGSIGAVLQLFSRRWISSEVNKSAVPLFNVIFEDEDFFFVAKANNVGCEPANEFHNQVSEYSLSKYGHTPRMLFPIEKVSSGITVFGKSTEAENHFYHYSFNRFKIIKIKKNNFLIFNNISQKT